MQDKVEYMSSNNETGFCAARIELYRQLKYLSEEELCKKCNLSLRAYKDIVENDKDIKASLLFKISQVLDVPICEFFVTQQLPKHRVPSLHIRQGR